MILCVTLNPCLDKTLTVPDWKSGDNVRGQAVREVVGGKGNNVARALARLGRAPDRRRSSAARSASVVRNSSKGRRGSTP